ncbi:MAG: HdeD family acid-resistance protein [Candidatus Sulfotelmatobacter sp.]
MTGRSTTELMKSNELAIAGAVFMIALGSVGTFLSIAMRLAPSVLSGWIFITGGFAYFLYAFATRDDGEALWRLLIGLLYIFGGFYLLLFFVSEIDLKNLIFAAGTIVLFEGVAEFVIFSQLRSMAGSGWIASGAIATIFFAFIIWCLWPLSSMRLIGAIVSTKFVISGLSRLMYSIATRKKLEAVAKEKRLLGWRSD